MKERKLPIILFSLVFASVVWVSVNLGNSFQTSIEMPVRIENLPIGESIALPLPKYVHFTIQGTGWQLLNISLSPDLAYTVDFAHIPRNGIISTTQNWGDKINTMSGIFICSASPETIVVRTDVRTNKRVAIVPVMTNSFREGFGIVGHIKTVPDSITITGARSLLQTINDWRTVPAALTDINAPVQLKFALYDTLPFEIVRPDTLVTVVFDVQPIAERTINDIPIEIMQVPEHRTIVLIPPKISIIVRSGVNNVANLSNKDFQAYIDYRSILLDTSGLMRVNVIGPDHVQIVQQSPELIQYVVRK
jgi:YbbR domain-containing protein